jgi:hypothetical protein
MKRESNKTWPQPARPISRHHPQLTVAMVMFGDITVAIETVGIET